MKLTDICDFQGGSQPPKNQWSSEPKEGYIRMLQIRDFTQDSSKVEYVKITNSIKKCNGKDILIARYGASIGKILTGLSGAYNVAMMKVVIDENIVDRNFIYNFLKSDMFQNYIKNVGQRAAQAGFNKEELSKININLPTLEEQKNIAQELNKVQEIIDIRKKQIDQLYELIKSQFVEMFGDPYFNRYNWKIGTIRELVSDVRYGTSKPSTEGGKYKYLRMNNITYNGKLDVTDIKYIDIPDNEIEKCSTKKGDILFNRTNSRELVGKTCVFDLDEKMVIAGFVIRVRVNELSNPYFLSEYLNTKYMKKNLYNMCKNASGQSNINAQELQNIKIYIPPIELQNQFADIVKQIDKQKFKVQESLNKMQNLYEALMDQYFG